MGKSAGPPLPFYSPCLGHVAFDVVGQGAAQQGAMDSALNAYQPSPPSLQELARAEVDRLRDELGRLDWLWWGWIIAGASAAFLKAVL